MRRITEVEIQHFQSHKRTRITFAPGVNALVGPSDNGKTAVIRALYWVLRNKPDGQGFIMAGETFTQVTVRFDDGTEIARRRGPKENGYTLTTPDGNSQTFESIGTKIPPHIWDAHGMHLAVLDTDLSRDLNFALQLDPPFLVGDPGTVRSKAVGQLSNAHIIDAAVRDTKRDEDKEQGHIEDLGKETTRLQAQLETFVDLPQHAQRLTEAAQAVAAHEAATEASQRIAGFIERQRLLDGRIEQGEARLEELRRRDFDQALVWCESAGESLAQAANCQRLMQRLQPLVKAIGAKQEALRTCGDFAGAAGAVDLASGALSQAGRLNVWCNQVSGLNERIGRGERFIANRRSSLTIAVREYTDAVQQLGVCPVCYAPADAETMRRISDNLGGEEGGSHADPGN